MKVHTPLNIAFGIWSLTVIINALLTDIVFWGFEWDAIGNFIGGFCMLFLVMIVVSFPVFGVLIVLLQRCRASGITGKRTLCIVYATGIACAAIVFYGFMFLLGLENLYSEVLMLLGCTVVSAILGITTQARLILNISAVEPE
ncbi:MAG TPA: hypothetical protein VFZ47_05030 [Chitinophagaceae bacterium]